MTSLSSTYRSDSLYASLYTSRKMSMSARLQNLYLTRIARQQAINLALFLHFDPTARDLRTWFWYVLIDDKTLAMLLNVCACRPVTEEGERVTPSDLLEYRNTHQFRTPSCFCGCKNNHATYTESAIYIAGDGPYPGEYVVSCVSGSCGYLSKSDSYLNVQTYLIAVYLVCIERMYTQRGLLLRRYLDRSTSISSTNFLLHRRPIFHSRTYPATNSV